MVIIRPIAVTDAAAFLALGKQLDQESAFMMLEPDERDLTEDDQAHAIEAVLSYRNRHVFVAESPSGPLIGQVTVTGGSYRRIQHNAYLVIGVVQAYSNMGIGTRLLAAAEDWAKTVGISRLELAVMTHNDRAIALYKRCGFQEEGITKASIRVNGQAVDQIVMAKLI